VEAGSNELVFAERQLANPLACSGKYGIAECGNKRRDTGLAYSCGWSTAIEDMHVRLIGSFVHPSHGIVIEVCSSDTWPGTGGVLGLTKVQIAEAKARALSHVGGAGFAYLQGPDRAIVEYRGDMPVERFNHVHMYQEDPFCAQLWYQKHLNAPASQGAAGQASHTEANCKVERGDRSWPALEKERKG
jgi:hypothetical protein